MQVKDYMQTDAITVAPEDLVSIAYERMHAHNIRHLPVVVEANQLVGLITDRDIRQAGVSDEPHMAEYDLTYLLRKATVQGMMTTPVQTVRPDTTVAEAGQLFLAHKFGCLPVVGDDEALAGILTVTDLLRAYVAQHETTSQVS